MPRGVARGADTALPTPRTTAADLSVTCNACLHSANADLAQLVADGFGDVPLIELRFRCAKCGSRDVFSVVSGARFAGY